MFESIEATPLAEEFSLSETVQLYPVQLCVKWSEFDTDNGRATYLIDASGEHFLYGELTDVFRNLSYEELLDVQSTIRTEVSRESIYQPLVPLRQWICDRCGGIIGREEATIEMLESHRFAETKNDFVDVITDLRIVHRRDECLSLVHSNQTRILFPLNSNGNEVARFLAYTEEVRGISDTVEAFREVAKRSLLPYYEQARHLIREEGFEFPYMEWEYHKYDRHILREVVIRELERKQSICLPESSNSI